MQGTTLHAERLPLDGLLAASPPEPTHSRSCLCLREVAPWIWSSTQPDASKRT